MNTNYSRYGINQRNKQLNAVSPKLFHTLLGVLHLSLLTLIVVLIVALTAGGCGAYRGILSTTPQVDVAKLKPSGYSTFVYDISGNKISKLVTPDSNRQYVTIDKIPVDIQHAFVAIEDSRFYDHDGVDLKGIGRAFVTGIKNKHFSEGASTITQQLLKNTVFTDWQEESSFVEKLKRKVQEQYLALKLEESGLIDKDTIMELYLNTINLGAGTLGIQAASRRYFDKDVQDLTLSEGAVLAAIPKSPTKYNPITHPENNAERREKVLNDMLDQGWITQHLYNKCMADDVYARIKETDVTTGATQINTYFIDALVEQVLQDLQDQCGMTQQQAYYQLYSGGLQIYSTQDPEIQSICDNYINNPDNFPAGTRYLLQYKLTVKDVSGNNLNLDHNSLMKYLGRSNVLYANPEDAQESINEYKAELYKDGYTYVADKTEIIPQPQLSAVIMDQSTGYVKAVIGGRGDKTSSLTFSRATDSMRQPGSTFKIVSTYLPALDIGKYSLATTVVDEPFNYENGKPVHNYNNKYIGSVTIRDAIKNSMNVIAVKTLTDITPKLGMSYLHKLGFTTLIDKQVKDGKVYTDMTQPLALGGITYGVKNVELCGAYATIANKGNYNRPMFYQKVCDSDGNVLLEPKQSTPVISDATAYLLTSAMEDVVKDGTGKVCNFEGQTIAGKTGTTSDNKDSWFAGYTPYYTMTVWAGYDDNTVLANADERAMAKKAWHDIMKELHSNLPEKQFVVPESVTTAKICTSSGKLAGEHCPSKEEYFNKEFLPTEECEETHYVAPVTPEVPQQLTPEQQAALAAWLQQQLQQQQQAQQAQPAQ